MRFQLGELAILVSARNKIQANHLNMICKVSLLGPIIPVKGFVDVSGNELIFDRHGDYLVWFPHDHMGDVVFDYQLKKIGDPDRPEDIQQSEEMTV
jgi:hypothetical protein